MFKKIFLTLFLGLSLFVSSAFADVSWVKFSYFSNTGGLNDSISPLEIQDNEATDIQNVVFDTGGAIKKRFGYITIPNTPSKVSTGTTVAITGLKFYKKDDGSRFVVAITNNDGKATAMYKAYETGGGLEAGNWKNIDFISLPSSYGNDFLCDFTVAQNNLIFVVPTATQSKPFKWTGTGKVGFLTTDTDCPTATILAYHKNHLILSGNSTNPSRVYFSNLDDVTAFDPLDFLDVETSDGSKVRGLVSAFNSLYIYKDRSIWRLSGTNKDDFVLEKMVDGIGTLSQQSIAVVNNLIYFTTAQNDIAVYDGNYTIKFISQKIRGTIGGLNFTRATNTLGLAFSTYKYVDYDYYASVTNAGSSTNNRVLFFDTFHNAWSKFNGINANAWTIGEDSVGQNLLLFGDYSGYVHYYPSANYYDGSIATSPISALYQTKWFRYSDISKGDKYWRLLKTYSLTENTDTFLTAEVRSDYESSGKVLNLNLSGASTLWDVSLWDVATWGGQGLSVNRNEINKGKSMFQIKYSNESVSQGFTIFGWETFIEPSDRI